MKVGIFTPVHKVNYGNLKGLAATIKKQSYTNYIWLILLNGEASNEVKNIRAQIKGIVDIELEILVTSDTGNVGRLKGICCQHLINLDCEILLEVDYDDLLHKDCIKEVVKAAEENEEAVFFYSNFAHFGKKEGNFHSLTYGEQYGWKIRPHKNEALFGDNILNEHIAFPALPQYLRRIESSPNHLRAFRAEPYSKIGYDTNLAVGDDHDLMCRFYMEYGEEGFYHINKCLYYQSYDYTSTTHTRNKEIQQQVDKNFLRYTEHMFKRWANDRDLLCLDMGGRFNCPKGYKSVDLQDADYIINLNGTWGETEEVSSGSLGFRILKDNSVGVIRANHILEHLDNPIHFFNEAYRVLAPGGLLLIEVPSITTGHAFADPTHKTFWSELNFEYYTNEWKARYIRPQYKGAFQKARVEEYKWPDGTAVILAHLISLKGWYNDNYWGEKLTDIKYIV